MTGAPAAADAAFIETLRLQLRRLSPEDDRIYCDLYTNPDTMKNIAPPLSSDRAARAFRKTLKLCEQPGSRQHVLTIVDTTTRRQVGICHLRLTSDSGRQVEGGIMLDGSWRVRGYGTEAFGALVRYGFENLPIDEFIALSRKTHSGILKGIGFTLRGDADDTGVAKLWAITRETWQQRNGEGADVRAPGQ